LKPTIWNIKANNNKWYAFKTINKLSAIKEFKNKFPSLIPVLVEEEPKYTSKGELNPFHELDTTEEKERKENELTE